MRFEKLPRRNSVTSPICGDGVSTYSPSIRQKSEDDGELYIAGQALVPVVNNPSAMHRSNSGSYGILSWPASAVDKAWSEASLPPPSSLHREVSYSHFEEYRLRVGTLMERYLHRRMSLQQDNARRLSVTDPEGSGYLRGEGLVQALRQVPSLFFQEDFSLTRPETFTQVIRGETLEERNSTLETLNNSLDIVETELLNEIAARSDSFFEAAESLQELRQSMGDTLFQIQRLQVHAHNIDDGMCSRAEHIQGLHKERSNLDATLETLKLIETVTHAQDAVNLLLLAHDYPSALDLIDNLKHQYEDRSPSGMISKGMEKLACLKNMPDALDASVVSLRACLVGELLELLNWDEGESVLRSVAAQALGEKSRSGTPCRSATIADQGNKKEKLKQILVGLSRTGSLSEVFPEIIPHAVSRLNSSLRNVMEILLPNFVHVATHEDDSPAEGSQSDELQCITHEMFLSLLSACFCVASACLTHYRLLGELLLEATDDGKILQHRATVERGRSDLCQALVDALHTQWAKLFQSRAKLHQKLNLSQLKELMETNQKCQELATKAEVKSTHKLGAMLQPLCKAALETRHRENLKALQEALETETWKVRPVETAAQQQFSDAFSLTESPSQISDEGCQVLFLEGAEYRLVHAGQLLVAMVCETVCHNRSLPEFVTDAGRHVIELVTVFNKRSCQLVLGAQAMQVSGLKSITAKHLALCSQSVLFFVHLHPHLTDAILAGCFQTKRTILQPEFDRLKQDLKMHLDGIHSKLIGIMKDRVLIGIGQLRQEMNVGPRNEAAEVCPPSQASQQIAKQLRILTQVLTPILHEQQMAEICTRVAEIFSEELSAAFQEMIEEFSLQKDTPHILPASEDKEAAACVHPLEPTTESLESPKEAAQVQNRVSQRLQLSSDCHFLIEILSKLPIGEKAEEIMIPLRAVTQSLV